MPTQHEEFRRAIRDLNVIAQGDIRALLRGLRDPRDAKAALEAILPDLVDTYGSAAGTLAADYYDNLRESAQIAGRFTSTPAPIRDPGTTGLIRWALGDATDGGAFSSLILGGIQKRITNVSRQTVMESSYRDPKARGWMRIGGGGCDFCTMLISRGEVYTESSVDFSAHDHDKCSSAPAWNETQVNESLRPYVDNAKGRADSTKATENTAAREWIADNL